MVHQIGNLLAELKKRMHLQVGTMAQQAFSTLSLAISQMTGTAQQSGGNRLHPKIVKEFLKILNRVVQMDLSAVHRGLQRNPKTT